MSIVSIVNMTNLHILCHALAMARYTLEKINQKIALWEAADDAVSAGQEYRIDGFRLTRADAAFIDQKLDKLYAEKKKIESGRSGSMVARCGRVAR